MQDILANEYGVLGIHLVLSLWVRFGILGHLPRGTRPYNKGGQSVKKCYQARKLGNLDK